MTSPVMTSTGAFDYRHPRNVICIGREAGFDLTAEQGLTIIGDGIRSFDPAKYPDAIWGPDWVVGRLDDGPYPWAGSTLDAVRSALRGYGRLTPEIDAALVSRLS